MSRELVGEPHARFRTWTGLPGNGSSPVCRRHAGIAGGAALLWVWVTQTPPSVLLLPPPLLPPVGVRVPPWVPHTLRPRLAVLCARPRASTSSASSALWCTLLLSLKCPSSPPLWNRT